MKHTFNNLKGILLLSAILIITFNAQAQSKQTTEITSSSISLVSTPTFKQGTVVLTWVTGQEKNINYFGIERSFTGKDFTSVGLALDGFENGATKEYAFKDISPSLENNEVVYYRLKQFDIDGTVSYGKVLVVPNKSLSKVDVQATR